MEHTAYLLRDGQGIYGLRSIGINAYPGTVSIHARADKVQVSAEGTHAPGLFHAMPSTRFASRYVEGVATRNLHQHFIQPFEEEAWRAAHGGTRKDYLRYYHCAKHRAGAIVNALLNQMYAEAIPADRLHLIRRYPVNVRSSLYIGLCRGGARAWQIADTFPALAIKAYAIGKEDTEVTQAIARGDRLNRVATLAGLPMTLRRFPPAAMSHVMLEALPALRADRTIATFAPATVPKMCAWLKAVRVAHDRDGLEYARWTARHFAEMGHWRDVATLVGDMGDWVSAGRKRDTLDRFTDADIAAVAGMLGDRAPDLDNARRRAAAVGRSFHSAMSVPSAITASDAWHEAVSQIDGTASTPFPEPWAPASCTDGFTISPIETAAELVKAGRHFHNCAATYVPAVARGDSFMFEVRNGHPVAMLELQRNAYSNAVYVEQLKGPCNAKVAAPVRKAVDTWVAAHKKDFHLPPAKPESNPLADFDLAGPIPF